MSLRDFVVRTFFGRWTVTPKEKYIEQVRELCELRVKNQGEESPEEEKLLTKIDISYDSLNIAEQDEVDSMESYCDHPDGWLADEWVMKANTKEKTPT